MLDATVKPDVTDALGQPRMTARGKVKAIARVARKRNGTSEEGTWQEGDSILLAHLALNATDRILQWHQRKLEHQYLPTVSHD